MAKSRTESATHSRTRELRLAREGVRAMLSGALQMSRNQQLLLVTSPGYEPEVDLISEVAARLEITVTPIVLPLRVQERIQREEMLPGLIKMAVTQCDGMIVLLDYSARTTPFRMAMLKYFTDRQLGTRAASMPGVRLAEFKYATADAEAINADAGTLGVALLRTRQIRVETWDGAGSMHMLKFPVIGRPTICGSEIAQGNWDNIPSGETFILPRPRSAQGTVAITGSIPGYVIGKGEYLLLKVDKGRITEVSGHPDELAAAGRNLFFSNYATRQLRSKNVTQFCEIGFGVNRAISVFHGLPIFDEKMYGTIHLAFGRNDQLGGKIKGYAHHDLVLRDVTVYSDAFETPMVSNGEILLSQRDTEPDWSEIHRYPKRTLVVVPQGLRTSILPKTGELILEWTQSEGSEARTRVGNYATSQVAGRVVTLIGQKSCTVGTIIDRLRESHGLPANATGAALMLLRSFGIITFQRQRPDRESTNLGVSQGASGESRTGARARRDRGLRS
jgi:hypothetical protein